MRVKTTGSAKSNKVLKKPQSKKIRIFLVDDYGLFRAGIKSLLLEQKDFSVIGEANDRDQAIDLIKNKKPDLILLNIGLKDAKRVQMIKELLAGCKTSRLLVLTNSMNPEFHRKTISSGATDFITTQDSPNLLIDTIRRVHAGGVQLDRSLSSEMSANSSKKKARHKNIYGIDSLTKRERDVIMMIGKGLKNKQVAEKLSISNETLHHHLTSVYSKLEVVNRLELIVYAYKHNLAEIPQENVKK